MSSVAIVNTAPPEAAPHTADLRRAARASAVWLMLGFGIQQAIRLFSTVIVPALLYRQAVGLMALALTVIVGLHMFADIGIRTAVVQSRRGEEPRFLATAWTLNIIRGFVLWGVACLLTYPVAYWREEPEPLLLWILPLIGFNAVIEGFTSTALYTLNRKLNQARAVLLEVGTALVGTAVTVLWAWLAPSPWALVAGSMSGAVTRTVLSHLMLPGGHHFFCWDREALAELSRIGRWVYLSTVCTFLAGYVDKLAIGLHQVATLGVYWVASQLANIPLLLMQAFAGQLTFPLLSRLLQQGHSPRAVFGPVHLAGNLGGALFVAGLLAAGPTAVLVLWDPRWHDAVWMMPLLATGVWLQVLEANAGAILFAQGHAHVSAASNAAKAAALFALVPAGFAWGGVPGVILAFVAGDLVRYGVTAAAIRRRGLPLFRYDLPLTMFVFGVGLAADWLVGRLWPGPTHFAPPDFSGAWALASAAPLGAEAAGSVLWGGNQRNWAVLLPRLFTAAAVVVVAWGALAALLRARGLLRWRW